MCTVVKLFGQRFCACFVLKYAHQRGEGEKREGVLISKQRPQNLWPKKYLNRCTLIEWNILAPLNFSLQLAVGLVSGMWRPLVDWFCDFNWNFQFLPVSAWTEFWCYLQRKQSKIMYTLYSWQKKIWKSCLPLRYQPQVQVGPDQSAAFWPALCAADADASVSHSHAGSAARQIGRLWRARRKSGSSSPSFVLLAFRPKKPFETGRRKRSSFGAVSRRLWADASVGGQTEQMKVIC